ncbi:MAG: hypothetical protein HC821_01110 [Lewinella sp.]|nr:hypothetical protein [Lewinella sp.]
MYALAKPTSLFGGSQGSQPCALIEAGLAAERIEVSPACTVANNEALFSYRHEGGQTGRMLALIGRR